MVCRDLSFGCGAVALDGELVLRVPQAKGCLVDSMVCVNPTLVHEYRIWVPCGKCLMCKVQRAREWSLRMAHEADAHEESVFVTLTFDEASLPESESICKDDLQKFFKRLRKGLEPRFLKYYACGEYGDVGLRPHYHAIVFGLSIAEHQLGSRSGHTFHCLAGPLVDAWPMGHVEVGAVCGATIRYVANYIKGVFKTPAIRARLYGERRQPFQMQSQGLGKAWMVDHAESLLHKLGCTVQGHDVGLPRYYQKKLLVDDEQKERFVEKAMAHTEAVFQYWKSRGVEDRSVFERAWASREQHAKTVLAGMKLRERKL